MAVHEEVLTVVQRLCQERGVNLFTPDDVVRALPHLNAQTVRTHVTSRCCVNARPHHQSRLAYFRKVGRGQYELLAEHHGARRRRTAPKSEVRTVRPERDAVHAIVTRSDGVYVVECHEVAVVTQGRTLDEALTNLTEAVRLHVEGEDLAALGLSAIRRIHVSYDLLADVSAA